VENSSEFFTVNRIDSWNKGERKQVRLFFFKFKEIINPREVHINFCLLYSHRAYRSQCNVFRSYLLIHGLFYDAVSAVGYFSLKELRDYEWWIHMKVWKWHSYEGLRTAIKASIKLYYTLNTSLDRVFQFQEFASYQPELFMEL